MLEDTLFLTFCREILEAMMVIDDVLEINRRLFYDLWHIANVSCVPNGLSPRLILPKKRTEDIRISEQEARFLYCSLLNNLNYFYSVETPTEEVYIQKGQTPQSAASDLSLYTYNNKAFSKVMNVEFKAHNPPEEHIRKDIEKLLKESIPGNWFHTLKNVDKRTLSRLFEKIANSLKACQTIVKCSDISILFSFCVLEKKWGCIKHFLYHSSVGSINEYIDDFFKLEYKVEPKKVIVSKRAGWIVVT